ncbi:hypothetical protein HELRODRAFT_173166 [Helobdella robusta]|uniref:Uncharacterized protein n=1 Tax=Helobdella robusta TaxID=6412 RepID=T1F6H7_HELRO|nr:hypothetical protein HELRODRAFT_173166 [Helobdella robusta]ESO04089.1 hypothetical protein HELRODRAFT_173166 [Helobdella robusta]
MQEVNNCFVKNVADSNTQITVEEIANRLLKNNFILTALELHMELLEAGRELSILRDYFSNPANFEQSKIETSHSYQSSKLTRTSSIQTFDSLDFARYSDDGDKFDSDKVAVLEFELRKAHEKINLLRSSITKSVDNSDPISKINPKNVNIIELESFEKRTLNFLINEYLLQNNYKLTSVTFSEENDNQDFDDWDDVGINICKPSNLICLYRDYRQHKYPKKEMHDFQCMTHIQADESLQNNSDFIKCKEYIEILKTKINELETVTEKLVEENCILKNEITNLKLDESRNVTLAVSEASSILERPNSLQNDSVKYEHHQLKQISKFQMNLIKLIDQKKTVFNYITDVKFIKLIEIIDILAFNLPNIISNTILSKRDELIPILTYTMTLHSDPHVRDKLLCQFFNLIKKPNQEQRLMLTNGCLTYSNYVGPIRTEAELLPFCWEQIAHKYREHRLLIAEISGYLSPYVINDTRSSLLFSMVKQMSEDNDEDVREAVVQSLAILISNFENDNKYKEVVKMLTKFFSDKSDKVLCATRTLLLPSLAKWSLDLKILEEFFKMSILENITNCIYTVSPTSSVVKDQKLFNDYILNLHQMLPYLLCHLVQTCEQFLSEKEFNAKLDDMSTKQVSKSEVNYTDIVDTLSVILDKEPQEVKIMLKSFYGYVDQEWFEMWDACDWVINDFIIDFVDISSRLEISHPALHSMVSFFRQLTQMFGANFSYVTLVKKFEKYFVIPLDEIHLDKSLANSQSPLNKSLVPIYLAGIYPALKNSCAELPDFNQKLQDLMVALSVHQSSLASLQSTFEELCSQLHSHDVLELTNYHNILIKLLWEVGVLNVNVLVRVSTAKLFECFITSCSLSETMLSSKVIPALVTLASDANDTVKAATVSSFGAIIEYVFSQMDVNSASSAAILEKVKLQLQAFMSESSFTMKTGELILDNQNFIEKNLIIIEVIKTLGRLGPKVESKFRDEFILPRLTALAVRSQLSLNIKHSLKHELTTKLLEAFINCSCCFVCHQVSQEVVLPGLRCLHHDIQAISPDRANIVMSMIKELEDKAEETNAYTQKVISAEKSCDTSSKTYNQLETTKMNFMTRFKDVKDKASHSSFSKVFQNSKN